MDDFSGVQKFQAYNFHKSLGITVLALMLLRLAWRSLNPVPALPASMPERQRMAARASRSFLFDDLPDGHGRLGHDFRLG